MKIHGIAPPMVTPFDAAESIDEAAFGAEVDYLIETAGVHGLGRVDISSQPDKCTDKIQKAKIRSIELLKSGKHPAKMFELIDKTLHQMTLAIPPFIIFARRFGAWMRWNDHLDALFKHPIDKILAGIAPISNKPLKGEAFNQAPRLCDVMGLPSTQSEAQRIAQAIHSHMNFGAKTTATAT